MASTPTATSPSTAAARHNLTNRSRPLKKLRISGKITHGPKTESEKLHPKPRNPGFLCPTLSLLSRLPKHVWRILGRLCPSYHTLHRLTVARGPSPLPDLTLCVFCPKRPFSASYQVYSLQFAQKIEETGAALPRLDPACRPGGI